MIFTRTLKKRTIMVVTLFLLVSLLLGASRPINAATNFQGTLYGFTVDEDYYSVSWDSQRKINTYYSGQIIGTTYIYIGKAVAKETINGQYYITYLIAVKTCAEDANYSKKVLWWTNHWTEYGYNSTCKLSGTLATGSTLVDSNPKYTVSDTSYSVGIGAGIDSSGASGQISGSVNFVDEAIDITNTSSTSARTINISTNLNESNWRWDWKRYKYAQQENYQLFTISATTTQRSFIQSFDIETKYGTTDAVANYWMNKNSHYGISRYYASTVVVI